MTQGRHRTPLDGPGCCRPQSPRQPSSPDDWRLAAASDPLLTGLEHGSEVAATSAASAWAAGGAVPGKPTKQVHGLARSLLCPLLLQPLQHVSMTTPHSTGRTRVLPTTVTAAAVITRRLAAGCCFRSVADRAGARQ